MPPARPIPPMSTPTRTAPGSSRALAGFTQTILDTADEAIVSLDRRGIVRSFNRAAERMFGWAAADIVGGHADRLMPRPENTRREDHLSPYLVVGGPGLARARKVVGLRRDGTRFPLDLSVSQFDGDDGPQFTWILRDMSEHTRLQEQLRHAQKMDAIGRLAGGVAHDVNNLLTVINGWCEALSSASAEERSAAIDQITSAASKAAHLTGQLLSFGRKKALNPSVLDLNPVIEDVGRMLHRVLGEHIRLEAALLETPAFVRIDQGQLGQVLVNLALNARDAMPRGGCLRIETAHQELDARAAARAAVAPGHYITLTVSDTGTGIPADAMPHLFEPFFTTKADRGTGLGLATVHAIVHQAGGAIAAANLQTGGARFTIRLPQASEGCQPVAAPAAPALDDRGSETVLVVEDEKQVRFITVSMLKSRGYRVLEAATCQDALTIATTEDSIDLLVSDVMMPELSGPELATRIRTVHPSIRVLLVSGYSADAVARHGVDGAAPSFLQKPFTGRQLAKKVREVLGAAAGSRAAGPTSAVVLQ
jgi:two-component system, cell cycle sensor histidine kinase and response regulator CckA